MSFWRIVPFIVWIYYLTNKKYKEPSFISWKIYRRDYFYFSLHQCLGSQQRLQTKKLRHFKNTHYDLKMGHWAIEWEGWIKYQPIRAFPCNFKQRTKMIIVIFWGGWCDDLSQPSPWQPIHRLGVKKHPDAGTIPQAPPLWRSTVSYLQCTTITSYRPPL